MPIQDHHSFGTVEDDIRNAIGESFEPRVPTDDEESDPSQKMPFRANRHLRDGEIITNAQATAVPWVYSCKHTGDFQGLFPTGRNIEINGVTVVESTETGTLLHRYIDWLSVLNQLGVDISWRVPVTEDEYRFGMEVIRERDRAFHEDSQARHEATEA